MAIDGKTARRSGGKAARGAIHGVRAVVASQRRVPGQVKVAEKSNEIVAIPRRLDLLTVEGALITIDGMESHRAIAQKFIDEMADDLFGLKGNQGSSREDVELFVTQQKRGPSRIPRSAARRPWIPTIAGSRPAATTVLHDVGWR